MVKKILKHIGYKFQHLNILVPIRQLSALNKERDLRLKINAKQSNPQILIQPLKGIFDYYS